MSLKTDSEIELTHMLQIRRTFWWSVRAMINSNKFVLLLLTVIFACILMILSSLKEIHNMQVKLSTETKQVQHSSATKKTYWLSAKNPDSTYMYHVREVFHHLGYERWDERNGDWDVMWSYEFPFSKFTPSKLTYGKKVNHFPGSGYLTMKVYLATSQAKCIPKAFGIPKDKSAFLSYAKQHPDKLWVQKNNNHRGITIKPLKQLDLDASDSFVQEYVQRPYLVDGKKFDIGLYVVITSIEPLIVYVLNSEWLIRYCPEEYYPFDAGNPDKYVVADDYTGTWEMPSLKDSFNNDLFTHKQTLFKHLRDNRKDADKLQNDLYQAIVDVLLEKQSIMQNSNKKYQYYQANFFELVRFDFVIDEDMNVYLMEVNMSPNMSSGHFTQNALTYRQVLFSTLNLVGVGRSTMDDFNKMPIGEREMIFSRRNIVAFPEMCASSECKSCGKMECSLCMRCLNMHDRAMLMKAQLEHGRRGGNFHRLYPAPMYTQDIAEQSDPFHDESIQTTSDKLLALWFKGKCMQDVAWCV